MPPQPSAVATVKPHRPYFFYGHRKPTQNRPTVRGGLFSNRQTINPATNAQPTPYDPLDFDLRKWDPDAHSRPARDPSQEFFSVAKTLSPIARYIVDSFRKHGRWGPLVVEDLNRLRRVTPKLVTEILKIPNIDPRLSSKFFYWAGKQKGYRHEFACYNAFAYSLNRTNQFRAADQIPELMHMQGQPPTEKQFEILIRMHSDANRGLRVYYVYEKMKKFDIKPRVFLYNRIMDALVKTNHLDLALSVYDDFRRDGLVEETVTFMVLIKGLCKSGQVNEAIELLDRMRKNLCKPDVFAYTAMVKVLVSEGNLDGCSRFWEEMKRDGIEPDVMAYGTFITGLCKGNQLEKGYELFEEMKEKKYLIDRAIYGSLIEAFVTSGKVGSACDLLKDMMNSGYRADLAIYNCLIEGLCNHRLVDRAYKLLRVTVEEDLQPDFFTVGPILLSYAESKRMDDFISLLEQMQKLGFRIRDNLSEFFSIMVKKDNGIMLAWELFEELKLKYDCSVQTYNVLMEALHSIGKVDEALKLFQELNDKKFHCDSLTYSIAIQCFIEINDIHEACTCYNRLREMSLVPSTLAYYSLVKKLCKIGEIDAAMMLIRDCLANVTNGPMEFKYTLTIIHASKTNDAEKVVEVLSEMIEQGYPPNNIIYCAIICGMCTHGTIEEARKVFTAMRVRKLLTEAEVVVYDELLIEQMKKKTADLVLCGLKFFGLERKLKAKGSKILLD
ncbi:PREDICTED: pentatricopeptide repeat-containing protein At4g20740 [Ipomoea nil]|uniref:pentatricopeptide repeat-containing protein At4g20740 n=1 Tax=Ipomoea nil TaxID=35883 RepID=UPI00090154D0|nr:PREDICTED: pentatricopeptide repeat-containing protein At4g20740 [Ipomoea nil]XP_019165071.1 PREDICTED: pentatricopeptide repeat-containing protein At4g20740 [Ipomoea nil]